MEGKKRKKRNFYLLIVCFIILTSAFFPLFKTVTGSDIYASFDPYGNIPPYQPTNPSPSNGSTNVELSITLKVYVTDPDNDTMEVYFYNAADDSLVGSITTASGYNATVSWSGLQSSTTYRWYAIANDSEYENRSQNWSFTTISSGDGDGDGDEYIPPNQKPIADITAPSLGYVNQILLFFANNSYDPDGNIIGYRWDFEYDGHWNTEWINDTFCFHNFSQLGNFTVRLQVKDDDGATASDYHNIIIQELPEEKMLPIPVTKVKYEGFVNENITFDSSGSYDPDGNITNFTWYFGDGNISYEKNPVHSYAEAGYYFVFLKVTDDDNLSNWAIATAFIRDETSKVAGICREKDQPLFLTWLVILLASIIATMVVNDLRKKRRNKKKKKSKDKKQKSRWKSVITSEKSGKDKPKKTDIKESDKIKVKKESVSSKMDKKFGSKMNEKSNKGKSSNGKSNKKSKRSSFNKKRGKSKKMNKEESSKSTKSDGKSKRNSKKKSNKSDKKSNSQIRKKPNKNKGKIKSSKKIK